MYKKVAEIHQNNGNQQLYGTPERTLTSDLPLRRRPLYTTELLGHIHFLRLRRIRTDCRLGGGRSIQLSYQDKYEIMVKNVPFADEQHPLRRRALYPGELRGHIHFWGLRRIRTGCCLGGGCSIQLSYQGI